MKGKKKPLGTKAQVRAMKERRRHIATAIFLTLILTMIVLSTYFAYTILSGQSSEQKLVEPSLQFRPETPNPHLEAAIVDQLSLTFPNQTFIETASAILTRVGYAVDYFSGEKVTVEFFRNLPTHGYRIIILREHSSVSSVAGGTFADDSVCFFTSEGYSRTSHVGEQLSDQLAIASYTFLQPPYYFAITPKFVTSSMKGNFQDSTVVMMGCEGLSNTKMAEAFIEKGAKVYVGWSESVLASQTDQATAHLLQHLILEKQTVIQAVGTTMKEVGPDAAYNSTLRYYPLESSDYSIQR